MTPTTAVFHGLLTILMDGEAIPVIAVASTNLFLIQLITSMDSRASTQKMVCATLWTARMSNTAASLIEKEILDSGLVNQLSADVTAGLTIVESEVTSSKLV